jgi:ligand-binding SRPBCC domain-containing protein
MRLFEISAELWLPCPRERLFEFFSEAANLERITPPWLHFHVLTPQPIEIKEGTVIDYQLRIHGIPLRWRTLISVWEPPHRFVDEQLKGPYRQWIHEHTFKEARGGTLCTDEVKYAVLGGAIVNELLVKRDVATIFEYRQKVLRDIF